MLLGQFGGRGFDYIAGASSAECLGTLARRVWLIGSDERLRRRLLTAGVQMTALDAQARFALAELSAINPPEPGRPGPGVSGASMPPVAAQEPADWHLEQTAPARTRRGNR